MIWTLLKAYDFNKPAGTLPDEADFWISNERDYDTNTLDCFTNRPQNVFYDGLGSLVFRAIKENYQGFTWTSGQVRTDRQKVDPKFSVSGSWKISYTFKQSAKGMGIWSALWGLGIDWSPSSPPGETWPTSREWDDLETGLEAPSRITGTAITPGFNGSPRGGIDVDVTQWHLIECEYDDVKKILRWLCDGIEYKRHTKATIPDWGFERARCIIMDLSILNNVDPNLTEVSMFVKDLKVYQGAPDTTPEPLPTPGGTMLNGVQTSDRGNGWNVEGNNIYAWSPNWAEYSLDFGIGGALQLVVSNHGVLPIPSGYKYQIDVFISLNLLQTINIVPGTTLIPNNLKGVHVVRLTWKNDAWDSVNKTYDANLKIHTIGVVSGSTPPPSDPKATGKQGLMDGRPLTLAEVNALFP